MSKIEHEALREAIRLLLENGYFHKAYALQDLEMRLSEIYE
jgi:mannitol/fructose-specific phosphotransferase system IIA component (Ntr-type)